MLVPLDAPVRSLHLHWVLPAPNPASLFPCTRKRPGFWVDVTNERHLHKIGGQEGKEVQGIYPRPPSSLLLSLLAAAAPRRPFFLCSWQLCKPRFHASPLRRASCRLSLELVLGASPHLFASFNSERAALSLPPFTSLWLSPLWGAFCFVPGFSQMQRPSRF